MGCRAFFRDPRNEEAFVSPSEAHPSTCSPLSPQLFLELYNGTNVAIARPWPPGRLWCYQSLKKRWEAAKAKHPDVVDGRPVDKWDRSVMTRIRHSIEFYRCVLCAQRPVGTCSAVARPISIRT